MGESTRLDGDGISTGEVQPEDRQELCFGSDGISSETRQASGGDM